MRDKHARLKPLPWVSTRWRAEITPGSAMAHFPSKERVSDPMQTADGHGCGLLFSEEVIDPLCHAIRDKADWVTTYRWSRNNAGA